MAIMVAETVRASTTSAAERRLFNRIRSELDDDCFVLHSLGLTNHQSKIWAECDFVILCRLGIFVIEVKGGQISCENGMWRFTGRHGSSGLKAEGPFEQAKSAMFAVREAVETNPALRGFLYGYGVIMPDEVFLQTGPEIEPDVLLDRRRYLEDLREYVRRLGSFWAGKYSRRMNPDYRLPDQRDLEEIRRVLRPDVQTALTLQSSLYSAECEQVELTEEQARILRRIGSNPRTMIRGGAGTGKTLLALDVAGRAAREGARVLYLCFNRLLGQHVREHVRALDSSGRLHADHIHAWFRRSIERAELIGDLEKGPVDSEEFYARHFPNVYMESVVALEQEPYDLLVVDEAQDILRPSIMDALDLTVRAGLAAGTWHMFMDPLQAIFQPMDGTVLSRLQSYGVVRFDLTVNCRNTRPVATTTAIVTGLDVPLEGAVEGGVAEVHFCRADSLKDVERALKKLLQEGLSREDIVILSPRRLENSPLGQRERLAGLKLQDLTAPADPAKKTVDFCTMQAFKGLERRAVVAVDLDDLADDERRLLHYCGLSRARSCLLVFVAEDQRESYARFAAEFGRRRSQTAPPPLVVS